MSDFKTRRAKEMARRKEQNEGKEQLFGQVVLFDIWVNTETGERKLTERKRTPVMPYADALMHYAEIPNPPSQLLVFRNEAEHKEVSDVLALDVIDPEWLYHLFQTI